MRNRCLRIAAIFGYTCVGVRVWHECVGQGWSSVADEQRTDASLLFEEEASDSGKPKLDCISGRDNAFTRHKKTKGEIYFFTKAVLAVNLTLDVY